MEPLATIKEMRACLTSRGQQHLLSFWDGLDSQEQQRLLAQLQRIDWEAMDEWITTKVLREAEDEIPQDLEPAPYYPLVPVGNEQQALYQEARQTGHDLLAAGKVAAFTVAGGQGTRLGYDGPKGTFPVSPVCGKSLFRLFAEGLARAQEKYESIIPWFIMTSPMNDAQTRAFFAAHDCFGLLPDQVMFMPQGVMPAIGRDGKLLLGAPDSLALSPNGHGGSLLALRDSGALTAMRERGIEHITYWQVDNPLVRPFDPLFLGLHAATQADMSCRSLTKTDSFEKLGNFCISGGKVVIIEYSDMPPQLAKSQDAFGRLLFRAGSPAIHILKRDFVDRITAGRKLQLPLHRALKKVPYVEAQGQRVCPTENNAVKLEMFIFDALPLAEKVLILEADRHEQFGPLKNAAGSDSVATCQQLMVARAARWLEQAGVRVPTRPDGTPDCVIELSSRRYLDPEDVKENAANLSAPAPGAQEYYD